MESLESLFSPVKIGHMELKNRIVLAPMATSYALPDGGVSQRLIDYHENQAKGGVGLIITGSASVFSTGSHGSRHLGIWDDIYIEGFRRLAQAVHEYGAKLAPQLVHLGPNPESAVGVKPVGPSAIPSRMCKEVPRELSQYEIDEIVCAFGEAARRAREAGCDAVEIHAAHGSHHIISPFMSALHNKRTDGYGGSLTDRLRFAVEVIGSVKERAGKDFPVILRMSGEDLVPGGRTLLETEIVARVLESEGVDAFEISGGVYPELSWRIIPPAGTPPGLNVSAAAAVKELVKVPVIVVGRIKDAQLADHIIASGKADLVSMGRALVADPHLPGKAAAGRFDDIAPCIGCNLGCVGAQVAGGSMTCVVNPSVGKEREMMLTNVTKGRKVMVIGGGPGGLETARIAALRGHEVMLCEKSHKLGGQFNLAAIPPSRQENALLIKYLSTQVRNAGARIELGVAVTPELVSSLQPDVVIDASGAVPVIPEDIPGIERDIVVTAHEVLAGTGAVGKKNIIVIGSGMVGCEVADFLAEPDDNPVVGPVRVTVAGRRPIMAWDMLAEPRYLLLNRLREKGVKFITSAHIKEVLDDGIDYERNGQNDVIRGADCVVVALGSASASEFKGTIDTGTIEFHIIGDAREPRTALEAMAEAAEVARSI